MCYLVTQKSKAFEYQEFYKASMAKPEEIEVMQTWYRADGFAHPKLLVLKDYEGKRELELQQWGLMPSWNIPLSKMLKLANGNLNARAETVRELKSFKNSVQSKRCIIPVDSFFEYKHVKEGKEALKLPYLIHPTKQPYFNLAGIYSYYKNPEDNHQWLTTFAIVTEPANTFMADIHNTAKRMPLMLSSDLINDWIDPNSSPKIIDEILKYSCDDSHLSAFRVRQDLKKVNDKTVLQPVL